MTFARIQNGSPQELLSNQDIVTNDVQFSYETMTRWTDAERASYGIYPIVDDTIPDGKVSTGSTLEKVGNVVKRHFTLVDIVPPSKDDLIAYAAQKRWDKEVGGISFSGVPIATDDRSKLMITGARLAADADPDWTTVWQGSDGNIYPLNATAMIAVSNAVSAHVGECFALFAEVKADIDSGEATTYAAVDAAFA